MLPRDGELQFLDDGEGGSMNRKRSWWTEPGAWAAFWLYFDAAYTGAASRSSSSSMPGSAARATRGWRGSRSAWLSMIGFTAVIFNFTIVNMFFKGLHAYSGLS